jgi:drug/metabolite transporter (DMT)-like permease
MATLQATRRGWRNMLHSGHPRMQALRAGLLLGNATCSFVGLQHLPLAEFTALAMLAPMASTLLASTVLRERVTASRWAMVGLGFVGMLVIVRPGSGSLGWAAAFPIAGALFFAAFQIVTQRLNTVDDMVTTNLFSGLGALVLLCFALVVLPVDLVPTLRNATSEQWLLIGLVGAVATAGQACMVMAIRSAPLSTLTPFGYAQIAFAAMISWLLFRHAPDRLAAIGMGLIALGGVATVWLNSRETASASQR